MENYYCENFSSMLQFGITVGNINENHKLYDQLKYCSKFNLPRGIQFQVRLARYLNIT